MRSKILLGLLIPFLAFGSSLQQVPPGTLIQFAGATCPTGYLLANGTAYPKLTYKPLYAAIGNAWGSVGANFNVPDLRGIFVRGVDGTANRDPDKTIRTAINPGGNTANTVGSYQTDGFASHTHTYTTNHAPPVNFSMGSQPPRTLDTGGTTAGTNATGGNETRSKNAYVNYCIKL